MTAGPMRAAVRAFDRFASRRAWSVFAIGALAFACCALVAAVKGIPIARAHDEQSYLLGADTFVHGRLANPTVPCWPSLEQFHVLMHPTFASKYPPAQAAFLAIGQLLWRPILGVWISVAAACAALCWMLQRWMAPRWALLASALCTLRLTFGEESSFYGTYAYWSRSYWGGAAAMLGGCLLLGSVRRIVRRRAPVDAVVAGVGVALLFNSRPFEGGLLCAALAAGGLGWFALRRPPVRPLLRSLVAPLALVLAVTGAWAGYYDWRVTGQPTKLPYAAYQAEYESIPYNPLAPRRVIAYRHAVFRELFVDFVGELFDEQRRIGGRVNATRRRLLMIRDVLIGPALALLVVATAWFERRDRWYWLALAASAAVLATAAILPTAPHYVAPITGAVWLLVARAMRRVAHLRRGLLDGRLVLVPLVAWHALGLPAVRLATPEAPSFQGSLERRAQVQAELERLPGEHVVLVRYEPDHVIHLDWVFNGADLEGAKIVWARDDARFNGALVEHYRGRRFWCVDGDLPTPDLHECTPAVARDFGGFTAN